MNTKTILIPKPCDCGWHDTSFLPPRGMTHAEGEPCPFAKDGGHRRGATCCSFDTSAVREALEALDEEACAKALMMARTSEGAVVFAARLIKVVANNLIELRIAIARAEAEGEEPDASLGPQLVGVETIHAGAVWFARTGSYFCGVEAA